MERKKLKSDCKKYRANAQYAKQNHHVAAGFLLDKSGILRYSKISEIFCIQERK